MLRWLLRRLLLMVPTLLGITFVTFAVMDLAPVDRAAAEVARRAEAGEIIDAGSREVALSRLRIRYGLVDPATLEPVSLWRRYGNWLAGAATFRLAGAHEDPLAFRRRLLEAGSVTLLLGCCSLLVSLLVGIPLGAWLGMHAGSAADRRISRVLFVGLGLPEFLVATLLLIGFAGLWLDVFPAGGLRSPWASQVSVPMQVLDMIWHLVLPVSVLSIGPSIWIARFLRDTTSRAACMSFAVNLRAWGVDPTTCRRRLLHNGAAPLATLAGTLLPMQVGGSIVVEQAFAIDGIGRMAWQAVREQDQAVVMALTLLMAVVTLASLILSDLLHRLVDPRVRLSW